MTGMATAWIIAIGAGFVAGAPVAWRARRTFVADRSHQLAGLSVVSPSVGSVASGPIGRALAAVRTRSFGPVGRVIRDLIARRRTGRDVESLRRQLPLVTDLINVAVGAGCTPFLAVRTTVAWMPAATARHLGDVLRACELGVAFPEALRRLGTSVSVFRDLADALATSERTGAPVGAALARTADDARASVRRATETRARTVPVRLLFPLVFLVLPAFGLLTVAPALLTAFART